MLEARFGRLALIYAFLILQGCDGCKPEGPDQNVAAAQATSSSKQGQQAERVAPTRMSDQEQLIALEHAYSKALIRRDRAFLEAYYAADWRGGNWMGFWTKATMLRAVMGDRYLTKQVTLMDVRARIVGDVGIVQGVSREVTAVDRRDTSGQWSFTDVFRRNNGKWQTIASHTSEVKAK